MFEWELWIQNKEKCEKAFNRYLDRGIIKLETEKESLSNSHLKRTNYNIDFVNTTINQGKFYSWAIVGCYYSIYHAALSLLSIKGYSSKNHSATLCALIYLYLDHEKAKLTEEDIKLIAKSSIEKQEVSYFVEAKKQREAASYGISETFTKNESIELRRNTILFVNKVKEILE